MNALRKLLLELLKVPPEPHPPPGASDSLRVFRAAPAYYRYNLLKWGFAQLGALIGIVVSLNFVSFVPDPLADLAYIDVAELFFIGILVVQAIITLALLRLRWELRWYIVSDRALRIREGIYRVREQTMTVANIQNMTVRQGPLQKLFGISDLQVRTAGGGASEKGDEGRNDPHLGLLAGLADAREVRDLILGSLGRHKDSGLGDPDDASHREGVVVESAATPHDSDRIAAADRLLKQVRGLRSDLASLET